MLRVDETGDTAGALSVGDDVRFDVCLLWDFLNYLNAAQLSRFAGALSDHVYERTRLHAFAAFAPGTSLDSKRYGILDRGKLSVASRAENVPHPHSQTEITKAFPGLAVGRATLLRENRQELFMTYTGKVSDPT